MLCILPNHRGLKHQMGPVAPISPQYVITNLVYKPSSHCCSYGSTWVA